MGELTYYVITFFQIFDPPFPFVIKYDHYVTPLQLLCQQRVNPPPTFPLKKCIIILRNRFRFILLFYSMYLAWEWTNKKSVCFSRFNLFVSIQLSFLHISLYHLWLLSTTFELFQIVVAFSRQNMLFGRQKVGFVHIPSKHSIKINSFRTIVDISIN